MWKKIAGLPDRRASSASPPRTISGRWATPARGPCSEIFYDHGEHIAGGPPGSPDADGDRFIETWNSVARRSTSSLPTGTGSNSPKPSIDTGMGLERMAAVLQGTHDNYAIDLFGALIQAVVEKTGVDAIVRLKARITIIADHLRASSFLIADGVLPSNEAGYVLRRIMRRAGERHAELLGAREPRCGSWYRR
ncbi:MAG: alanine--tRNA ligase-related protein [Xanthobacteraceae bacterium]